MKKILFILIVALVSACSVNDEKPNDDNGTGSEQSFLELIPGSYLLEGKTVTIRENGHIYDENNNIIYNYKQEKTDDYKKAYYTDSSGSFVGLEIIINDSADSKNIILYKPQNGTWISIGDVQFTPENVVGDKEELFKTYLQGIGVFYNVPIEVSADGSFTVKETNYTFHQVKSSTQAVYSVKKENENTMAGYVGLSVDNATLIMYLENKRTPWVGTTSVSFESFNQFEGYFSFLELIPGSYLLEGKTVTIRENGHIYDENNNIIYNYKQEKTDDYKKAYYTDSSGSFVGLEIIINDSADSKNIILYKPQNGIWTSIGDVQFTPENVVGDKEELFKTYLQGIGVFYNVPIEVSADGSFTVRETNYTFHSANSPNQAVYSVNKVGETSVGYVGLSINGLTLTMYLKDKLTPWVDTTTVLFDISHEFEGYPDILFREKIGNINNFYGENIIINNANFSARGTNYTFHRANLPTQAVYSVKKENEDNIAGYVGISTDGSTLTMYLKEKTTPWSEFEQGTVNWNSENRFEGYFDDLFHEQIKDINNFYGENIIINNANFSARGTNYTIIKMGNNNNQAIYSVNKTGETSIAGYVGISTDGSTLTMYLKEKTTPWVDTTSVWFYTSNQFAGYFDDLFHEQIKNISDFYGESIIINNANFSARGTNYTIIKLGNYNHRAVYSVKKENEDNIAGYVGISIEGSTLTMYLEDKLTPWVDTTSVSFYSSQFAGYTVDIFYNQIKNINNFYSKTISINTEANFSAGDTNYTFIGFRNNNNNQAVYSVRELGETSIAGYVGIFTDGSTLTMYLENKLTPWVDTTSVRFYTSNQFAGYPDVIFHNQIKNINNFYSKTISINTEANFSVGGTNYTIIKLGNNNNQAIYSVNKTGETSIAGYVGISTDGSTLTMYLENKLTPWVDTTSVLFDISHEFEGYPDVIFHNQIKNITKFYRRDITVDKANFSVSGTNYNFVDFKNNNNQQEAIYSVRELGETSIAGYVGISTDGSTLTMYLNGGETPWVDKASVSLSSFNEFGGYPGLVNTFQYLASYNIESYSMQLEIDGNAPYVAYTMDDRNNTSSIRRPYANWAEIGKPNGSFEFEIENGVFYTYDDKKVYKKNSLDDSWTAYTTSSPIFASHITVYNEIPYIYGDDGFNNTIFLYKYDKIKSVWTQLHSENNNDDIRVGFDTALLIQDINNIYMTYRNNSRYSQQLVKWSDMNTTSLNIIDNGNSFLKISCTLDGNGVFYSAYAESINNSSAGDVIRVKSLTGLTWNSMPSISFSSSFSSVVLGLKIKEKDGILYIASLNLDITNVGVTTFSIKINAYENGTWNELMFKNYPTDSVSYTSGFDLEISDDGKIVVVVVLSDERTIELIEYIP